MLNLDLEDAADRKQVNKILKAWFANRVLETKEREDEHRNKRPFVVPGSWNDGTDSATVAPFPAPAPISSAEKDALKTRGFADADIFDMAPQRARAILENPNRTATSERFRVIGPTSAQCLICQRADGEVRLIKDVTRPGTRPEPLHPGCAPEWFKDDDEAPG